jgi:hypothetical protein
LPDPALHTTQRGRAIWELALPEVANLIECPDHVVDDPALLAWVPINKARSESKK